MALNEYLSNAGFLSIITQLGFQKCKKSMITTLDKNYERSVRLVKELASHQKWATEQEIDEENFFVSVYNFPKSRLLFSVSGINEKTLIVVASQSGGFLDFGTDKKNLTNIENFFRKNSEIVSIQRD